MIVIFIVIERLILFLSLFISLRAIPYLGFFPYREELLKYHLPRYIYSLANFDGIHYMQIARKGYEQYTQAYFPMYPSLISLGGYLVHNHLVVALLISNVASLGAFYVWGRFINELTGKKIVTLWSIAFLVTFPTSFFFSAAYTESLFFLFVTLCLGFLSQKKYISAGVATYAAALTRFMGVFLILPLAGAILLDKKMSGWKKIGSLSLPLLGLVSYMYYLWITYGDALYFIHAQAAFGANRSTHIVLLPVVIYRYINIFITAAHNLQYIISVFEFFIFALVFVVLLYDLYRLWITRNDKHHLMLIGLSLFSLLTILIPASSGTLSSLPRYALLAPSFFISLPRYITQTWVKLLIAFIFVVMQILLFGLFMQGYFVS